VSPVNQDNPLPSPLLRDQVNPLLRDQVSHPLSQVPEDQLNFLTHLENIRYTWSTEHGVDTLREPYQLSRNLLK
tara:strand:+ start:318 stop:539 length:222 start_codon:yes stop_codon:yes gene_type:complete